MVWGCAANTVKCLVIFFNFLAFISGLALLVAGVVFLVSSDALAGFFKVLTDNGITISGVDIKAVLYIAIIVGGILMLLGFLGCCGALCENSCLLSTFAVIMVIMLCVQVAGAVVALVYKDKAQEIITTPMQKSYDQASTNIDLCNSWPNIQKTFKCCGVTNRVGPPKCTPSDPTQSIACDPLNVNNPCDTAIWSWFETSAKTIGIVILVFSILELAAVIFSCCLCCEIRKGRHLYDVY